jgi:hypothetical protein
MGFLDALFDACVISGGIVVTGVVAVAIWCWIGDVQGKRR